MSNPALFFDDWQAPTPIILDFYQTNSINIRIATRTAKIFIKDSENRLIDYSCVYPTANYAINKDDVNGNSISISYTSIKTTEQLKLYPRAGIKDIKSIVLVTALSVNGANYVINDWYNWLNQFTALESVNIFLARQTTIQSPFPIIKGNMIRVPKQVKYVAYDRLYLENPNVDFYCDFNNINADSQLKYFRIDLLVSQVPKVVGDLKNLPSTVEYFKIVNFGTGSNAVYTGVGKVFSPTIDNFYFNRVLSTAQLNQLLIDLNNSVTTAIGDKLIYLRGTRSSVSDSAVASLQAKGFTVTITA